MYVGEALSTDQHPGADVKYLMLESELSQHALPSPAIDRSRILLMLSCALNLSSASSSH